MKTHTPGPWSIDDNWPFKDELNRQFPAVFKHTDHGDLLIASFEHAALREHNDANARLIAAAPDLLEACKYAAKHLGPNPPDDGDHCREAFEKLTAAIAKATK